MLSIFFNDSCNIVYPTKNLSIAYYFIIYLGEHNHLEVADIQAGVHSFGSHIAEEDIAEEDTAEERIVEVGIAEEARRCNSGRSLMCTKLRCKGVK